MKEITTIERPSAALARSDYAIAVHIFVPDFLAKAQVMGRHDIYGMKFLARALENALRSENVPHGEVRCYGLEIIQCAVVCGITHLSTALARVRTELEEMCITPRSVIGYWWREDNLWHIWHPADSKVDFSLLTNDEVFDEQLKRIAAHAAQIEALYAERQRLREQPPQEPQQ